MWIHINIAENTEMQISNLCIHRFFFKRNFFHKNTISVRHMKRKKKVTRLSRIYDKKNLAFKGIVCRIFTELYQIDRVLQVSMSHLRVFFLKICLPNARKEAKVTDLHTIKVHFSRFLSKARTVVCRMTRGNQALFSPEQ